MREFVEENDKFLHGDWAVPIEDDLTFFTKPCDLGFEYEYVGKWEAFKP